MAAVHPSRLGLVPQSNPPSSSSRDREDQSRYRSTDGRDDSYSRDRRASPSYQPYARDDRDSQHREADYIPLGGSRDSGGRQDASAYGYGDARARQVGYQDRSRDDGRDTRYFDRDDRGGPPPWRNAGGPGAIDQGYGGGRGGPHLDAGARGPPGGGYRGGGGGGGFRGGLGAQEMEARRQQREQSSVTVWPPSPKRAQEDDDDLGTMRKSSSSKKHKSSSKHRSKHRSSRHKSSSKHKSSRRHRHRSDTETESSSEADSDDSEDDRRRRKRKSREVSEQRSETKRSRRSEPREEVQDNGDRHDEEEDAWVVADGEEKPATASAVTVTTVAAAPGEILMDDEEVGPQVPAAAIGKDGKVDMKAYAHMRPGEGAAMAAYAASGQRIPRRGEIGLSSEEIEKYESSGYVMSGSRHRRMNAVRMRKENQVISAEEKRGILKLQKEEKEKREGLIVSQFKEMMEDKLAKAGVRQ